MQHLVRGGVLLAGALLVALTLRTFLTPEPTRLSSTYRLENVGEWASWPVRLAGAAHCTDCHEEISLRWQVSKHRTVPCEDCHGATRPHLEHKASLVLDISREFCGTCHAQNLVRPQDFPQVDLSEHWQGTACVACHNPHDPWAYKPSQLPHELVGFQDCLSCHNATAANPVPEGHQNYDNYRCLSCHPSS